MESSKDEKVDEERELEPVNVIKTSKRTILFISSIIFLIGALTLIIALSLTLNLTWWGRIGQEKVCGSRECNRTARDMRAKMNESVSPCEDFYEVQSSL